MYSYSINILHPTFTAFFPRSGSVVCGPLAPAALLRCGLLRRLRRFGPRPVRLRPRPPGRTRTRGAQTQDAVDTGGAEGPQGAGGARGHSQADQRVSQKEKGKDRERNGVIV